MRRIQRLGAAALIFACSSLAPATAKAASFSSPAPAPQGIRDTEVAPSWERKFLKNQPVSPLTNGLQLASAQTGQASWYGPGFYGNRTASGEVFRPGTMTAAHRTLPFGTMVRVTNLWNGRSAVVRINDRGPFHGGRVIDLAHGAAHQLGVTASGVASVKLEILR